MDPASSEARIKQMVRLLQAERPDLLPLLSRLCANPGFPDLEDELEEDLAELVRRGFLVSVPIEMLS